jgi:hypothetical protein
MSWHTLRNVALPSSCTCRSQGKYIASTTINVLGLCAMSVSPRARAVVLNSAVIRPLLSRSSASAPAAPVQPPARPFRPPKRF